MMPQPFVLAVPRKSIGPMLVTHVPAVSTVIGDRAALWRGETTRLVRLGARDFILGVLFRNGVPAPGGGSVTDRALDGNAAALARHLLGAYWGAYCAVLGDPASGELAVMPDPSGQLPVYRAATATHVVLTSDPRLFAAAGMPAPSVSWAHLRAHLLRPDLRRAVTCLDGVCELVPGRLVRLGRRDDDGEQLWRVDAFMPRGPAPDFGEAAAALRTSAIEAIGAWARLAGPVAVAASGGVDSSLICAALSESGHAFDCVTLATGDPSGDERVFAGALAEHLGVRLVAAPYDPARVNSAIPASAGLARPSRKTFMQALDAALDDARQQLGAAAVFDGNGGDSLFCFLHSAAPVLDCLAAAGLRPALATFIDMCGVTGCDAGTMAAALWRRARKGGATPSWPPDMRLLARVSPADCPLDPLTPWRHLEAVAYRGKREHLDLLMRALNHVHGLGGTTTPRFSPLLSQPMVERCLSLPTWLWCRGGINRAMDRAAFADRLPPAVRRRRSKAGPDSFIRGLFAVYREQVRQLLLDGRLAAHGLIDRGAVADALATDVLSGDTIVYRLLDLVEAEAWARSWDG
jgi:asparagine synthase (glutamine-hydrolysing)